MGAGGPNARGCCAALVYGARTDVLLRRLEFRHRRLRRWHSLASTGPRWEHLDLPNRHIQGSISSGGAQPLRRLPHRRYRVAPHLGGLGIHACSAASTTGPLAAGARVDLVPRRSVASPPVGISCWLPVVW